MSATEHLPAAESGELRGPMSGAPLPHLAATYPPLTLRLLRGLEAREDDDVIVEYPRGGTTWTASALRARAEQLARALVAAGVRPGDRVMLVAGYHAEYAPLLLATLLAGAAWSPLNPGFDDGDFRLLLAIIEPRVVLAPVAVARRLQDLLAALEAEGPPESGTAPRVVALYEGAEWDEFLRERAPPPPLPPPPADPLSAPALVCCSSGTSGLSKGVILSHFSLATAVDAILHEDSVPKLDCTMVITSPGFWVTGIYYTLIAMLMPLKLIYEYGCTEKELLSSIHKYKPAILFSSNNFMVSMAKTFEEAPAHDLSSLRTIIPTGAAMSRDAEDLVHRVTGCNVQQIYGMTEVAVALGLTKHNRPHRTGSVGKLIAFMQCKVVDPETGLAVGAGQEGELCFKGPSLTSGYLKNPRATAELFDEHGWLHSGDLGHYDEDEIFFVTGRIKDTIKYRGVHVSPSEIEGVLGRHPQVLESGVVGVMESSQELELPRAYVVLRPGATASAEELCSLVQEQLAPHKWLRGGVEFVNALPKTATGKISRAAIRKRFLQKIDP